MEHREYGIRINGDELASFRDDYLGNVGPAQGPFVILEDSNGNDVKVSSRNGDVVVRRV